MLQLHVPVPLRLFVSTYDSVHVSSYVIGCITFYYKYPVVAIVRTLALYLFTFCKSIPLIFFLTWLSKPHRTLAPLITFAPTGVSQLAHIVLTLSPQGHNMVTCMNMGAMQEVVLLRSGI